MKKTRLATTRRFLANCNTLPILGKFLADKAHIKRKCRSGSKESALNFCGCQLKRSPNKVQSQLCTVGGQPEIPLKFYFIPTP